MQILLKTIAQEIERQTREFILTDENLEAAIIYSERLLYILDDMREVFTSYIPLEPSTIEAATNVSSKLCAYGNKVGYTVPFKEALIVFYKDLIATLENTDVEDCPQYVSEYVVDNIDFMEYELSELKKHNDICYLKDYHDTLELLGVVTKC